MQKLLSSNNFHSFYMKKIIIAPLLTNIVNYYKYQVTNLIEIFLLVKNVLILENTKQYMINFKK